MLRAHCHAVAALEQPWRRRCTSALRAFLLSLRSCCLLLSTSDRCSASLCREAGAAFSARLNSAGARAAWPIASAHPSWIGSSPGSPQAARKLDFFGSGFRSALDSASAEGEMKRRRAVGVTSPRVGLLVALGRRRRRRRRCRLPSRTDHPHCLLPALTSQAGSKDASKLDALFNLYKDKSSDEDVIGPEGALLASACLLLRSRPAALLP